MLENEVIENEDGSFKIIINDVEGFEKNRLNIFDTLKKYLPLDVKLGKC